MAKRVIDLTLPIESKGPFSMFPRKEIWGQQDVETVIEPISAEDEWPMHKFQMSTESYTHIHVPRNLYESGWSIEQVPPEHFMGEAVVLDMSHKKEREAITAKDLAASNVEVRKGDIAIIRTGWSDKMWGTREFWVDMPYLTEDACDWLIEKGIKVLVMDTYNDLPFADKCASCGKLHAKYQGSPTHYKFLKNNILLVEYATNLHAIKKDRVQLICLPIKLTGVGQAPARVVAIED